jgi:hypothetical protein
MTEIMHERRRLLLSTAGWVGGLAAVIASRPARVSGGRNAARERGWARLCQALQQRLS